MELKAHSKFSRADFKLRLFLPSPFSFAENGSGATLWCCDDQAASSENDNLGPPFPWWKKITRHHNDKSTTIMDIGPILASFQSGSSGTPEEIAELQAASLAIALHNNILGVFGKYFGQSGQAISNSASKLFNAFGKYLELSSMPEKGGWG
ncbi:hypothetical protein BT96DRAFT_951068 [Gymnopus androsaceus JB14]|uniref:Uncharacterized protein n=1 Tax=Gymnopus androsaceus JB14 TaxID=1447944 RepID=A0A6A4GE20_9AGAR|nr:hypothetical protein BT96DRAFT_951068 [Gymnopus androsaceus JB14]